MTRNRHGHWPWQGDGRGLAPKTDGGAVQRAADLRAVAAPSVQFRHAGDADALALRRRRSVLPLVAGTSAFPAPDDLAGRADRHAGAAAGGPARPASPPRRAPPVRPPGKAYRPRGDFGCGERRQSLMNGTGRRRAYVGPRGPGSRPPLAAATGCGFSPGVRAGPPQASSGPGSWRCINGGLVAQKSRPAGCGGCRTRRAPAGASTAQPCAASRVRSAPPG